MSLCQADQRERVRAAVERLEADPRVAGAVVIEPDTDPTARWTVDAVLDTDDGVPTPVQLILVGCGLTIHDVSPQGDGWQLVAIA